MRFLIADRRPSARSALRLLLEQYPDMDCAGESGNFEGLLDLAKTAGAGLVLAEWEVLGAWPKGSIAALKENGAQTVVVLGCCLDRTLPLKAGADYYVSKGDKPEHLIGVLLDIRGRRAPDSNNDKGKEQ